MCAPLETLVALGQQQKDPVSVNVVLIINELCSVQRIASTNTSNIESMPINKSSPPPTEESDICTMRVVPYLPDKTNRHF